MDISVRELENGDYASIDRLIREELGYADFTQEELSNRMDAIQRHDDYHTFVAINEGQVIGLIGLCKSIAYEFSGCYLRIVVLAVDHRFQGMGVGTKLTEVAERYAMMENCKGISLDSGFKREDAHIFYERRGYEKNGYRFGKNLQ